MKLNGITCDGWREVGADGAEFSLSGTSVEEAAAAVADTTNLTEDDGTHLVASFAGHRAVSVSEVGDGTVRLRTARELDAPLAYHIHAIEANVKAATEKVDESARRVTQAEANVETAVNQVSTYESRLSAAESTASKATSAVSFMSQQALPQLISASSMYVSATQLSDSELPDVKDLVEEFVPGKEYAMGTIRKYEGKYWRMAQDIDATTSQTYQPGQGTESLYTLIDLAPDGIRVWHMPTGSTDAFELGEQCHYPDADGLVYVSKREGNTSEPTKDEWWKLEPGQDVPEEPEHPTEPEQGTGEPETPEEPEDTYPEQLVE